MPGPGKRNCGNKVVPVSVGNCGQCAEGSRRTEPGAMEICGESEGPELYLDALQKDLVLIRQLQELSDKQDYDQMVADSAESFICKAFHKKKMEGVSEPAEKSGKRYPGRCKGYPERSGKPVFSVQS